DGRAHAGVELLFTPKEEVGLVGAAAFDDSRLDAKVGYVYDHAGPVGEVILGAPYQRKLDVHFHGRAAHAGMYPEEGRSAIFAASRAIADLRLGRLDDETTANVGEIEGGTARNVVPEHCRFTAEARSHDERKLADVIEEMLETITFAAGVAECEVETQLGASARGYRFRRDDVPVRLAADALYANLTRGIGLGPDEGAHVMKLPYTPLQVAVRHVEEDASLAESLDGMPVVCCSLHSQVAPVCAGLGGVRVAYVQVPGGALP